MRKLLATVLALCLFAYSVTTEGKSGSSSSSSSKPSTGSSFSKPSSPSVRPNTGTTPSSRPNSDAHTTPSTRPNTDTKPNIHEDVHTTPSTRPGTGANTTPTGPPKGVFHSNADAAAVNAKARSESKIVFENSKPPASTYKAPSGKDIHVDPKAPSVDHVRNTMTPEKYQQRTVRVEHHYHNYYGPRYDYYRSQPYIYVGGGYSPLFWYAMLDWDINRRAMWMYHNQSVMDQQLYQQQLSQNADLRARVAALESQGMRRDPRYIDPEFKENPDLMYDDGHIAAVVHPSQQHEQSPDVATSQCMAYRSLDIIGHSNCSHRCKVDFIHRLGSYSQPLIFKKSL